MKLLASLISGLAMMLGTLSTAAAQDRVSAMLSNCSFEAATRLGGNVGSTSVKYEGQRVDGTHAINGSLWVGGRNVRFQCSYAAGGVRLVKFWSDAQQAGAGSGDNATSVGVTRVRFASGRHDTTVTGRLRPGKSARYLLGARNGQFLRVSLRPDNGQTYFIIRVPGGKILFDSSQGGNEYYGQLYRNGDHEIEVIYNGNRGTRSNYDVYFQIK